MYLNWGSGYVCKAMRQAFALFVIMIQQAFCTCACGQTIKPSILNATGGSGKIDGRYSDYSIGEMTMVSTFSTPGLIVTQGLMQTDLFPDLGIASTNDASQIEVFPNPASTIINIRFTSKADGELKYWLIDMTGKVVSSQTANVNQGTTVEQINSSGLAAASYLLQIAFSGYKQAAEISTFKIEKLK